MAWQLRDSGTGLEGRVVYEVLRIGVWDYEWNGREWLGLILGITMASMNRRDI